MIEWNEERLTEAEVARMTDEEILARMRDLQRRMEEIQHKEEIVLEVLARKDPELAAEMRKQKRR